MYLLITLTQIVPPPGPATPPAAPTLFTLTSLATMAGASAAVTVLTNVLTIVLRKVPPAWVALVFSLIVAFVGAATLSKLSTPIDYFVALLNGCLLFTSAAGVQETLAQIIRSTNASKNPPPPAPGSAGRKLTDSWFR